MTDFGTTDCAECNRVIQENFYRVIFEILANDWERSLHRGDKLLLKLLLIKVVVK
jgi:hypothetical protein